MEEATKVKGKLWLGSPSEQFESSFFEALLPRIQALTLEPTVVLVGSNLLALHLRRKLALQTGGHCAVRWLTFLDLAQLLLRDHLARSDLRSFPAGGEELLIGEICCHLSKSSPFFEVREREGFHRALLQTFHDLLESGVTNLGAPRGKLGELSRLFTLHRKGYRSRYLSAADQVLMASQSEVSVADRLEIDHLFCYGFYDLSQAQRMLLKKCSQTCSLQVWVPAEDDPPPFVQKTVDFFRSLASGPSRVVSAPTVKTTAISAPDEYVEAEAVVRWLLEQLDERSIPLHRIAIALRRPETYLSPFISVLKRSNLPYYLEGGEALAHSRPGRALLALLDLLGSDWSRDQLLTTLALIPWGNASDLGEPGDWDRWTREAFLTRRSENPWARLSRHARRCQERADTEAPQLQRFVRFLEARIQEFDALEEGTSNWVLFSQRLGDWISSHFFSDELTEKLAGLVSGLADMEELGVPATLPTLVRVLRSRISSARFTSGGFEKSGLYLGSVLSIRSVDFDLIAIPGLSEGSFPSPARPDPLLLEAERRAVGERAGLDIPSRETRNQEERFLFALLFRQARQQILLSYPRFSGPDQRPTLPSLFFREVVEANDLEVKEVPLLSWQRERSLTCLDANEWLTCFLGRAVLEKEASAFVYLRRRFSLFPSVQAWVEARLGEKQFGLFDGLLKVPDFQIPDRLFSASEIATYATCPYRYYLGHLLRLKKIEYPEEVRQLRAMDRGTIVHEILFRLFSRLREEDLLPLKAESKPLLWNHLEEIAGEVFSQVEQSLPLGPQLLWENERDFLLSDLRSLLEAEIREGSLYHPLGFEVRFGMGATTSQEDPELCTDEPLVVETEEGKISLRGRIDRLDITPDRKRARIVDYKTGALRGRRDDRLDGGKAVQLPIYLSTLPLFLKGVPLEQREALLLSTAYGSGFRRVRFSGAALAARWKEFQKVLGAILYGTRRGLFCPRPGDGMENCRFCDFTPVCGRYVGRLYERKSEDPVLAPLREVEEIL